MVFGVSFSFNGKAEEGDGEENGKWGGKEKVLPSLVRNGVVLHFSVGLRENL